MSGWRLRVLAVAAALAAGGAQAQTVKVGVVLPFTGVGAEFGQQVDRGMQMFLKLNPGAFAPYKVELVKRDSKNPSGAEAKTAVQELIAQEKVDILAGFIYSPDAIASAPLATAAKKP
ncbi:MAG: ABC transporter substrate-binding protein, partial [Betaproteobacteria bacterium]|nr:ABC transporter substrate-binding protein [Betaproteobacteria bacterium]